MENNENAVLEDEAVKKDEAEQTSHESEAKAETGEKKNAFARFGLWCKALWDKFKAKHPNIAQFLVFFVLCNAVTVLQLILMPVFQSIFNATPLVDVAFQVGRIGNNFDGTPYYMFNYASGPIDANGLGGGLAYFLAIQITLAIAQVINFFAQRNVTFKGKNNIWIAAGWYTLAYVAITLVAALAQGFYKAPIYKLLMTTWGLGDTGRTIADIITMIINSAISFWVFFPIMKFIFKTDKKDDNKDDSSDASEKPEVVANETAE